ncbi:copia-like retrotransposon polyprotein [Hordeum vulgare]|nr:copia-like retrotransposon polyprotein [Hordeum vulgare]
MLPSRSTPLSQIPSSIMSSAPPPPMSSGPRSRITFLANCGARFMLLNCQYRNLKQGDLSVTEYARRLKLLTDGLVDIDYAVTEVDLTTQFLHGLYKRLDTIRVVLGDQGLPFDTVLSRVVLAEESMTHRAAEESAFAFALPGAGSSSSTASGSGGRSQGDRIQDRGSDRPPANHPHPPQQQRGRGDGGGRGRGRGRGLHNSGGRGQPSHPPAAPFAGYFALYGMAIAPPRPGWVPPNSAGVLGPRPGSHVHAYPMFQPAPSPPSPYFPAQPPSWDHLAMLNAAYSNGGVPATPSPDWYFDSGASSHITGTSGNLTLSSSSLQHVPSNILVGNGQSLPATATSTAHLTPLKLS